MSSSHELGDSSSTASDTKVSACVGEDSINQLGLASTYLKTFLIKIHFQLLVGKRFYIFFNCPRNKRKSVLSLTLWFLHGGTRGAVHNFYMQSRPCCTGNILLADLSSDRKTTVHRSEHLGVDKFVSFIPMLVFVFEL